MISQISAILFTTTLLLSLNLKTESPSKKPKGPLVFSFSASKLVVAPKGSATAGSRWIETKVTFANTSSRSVWIYGYSLSSPFYDIQTRSKTTAKWKDYGLLNCGTGARLLEMKPGTKHTFTAALPAKYTGAQFRVVLDFYTERSAKLSNRAASGARLAAIKQQ